MVCNDDAAVINRINPIFKGSYFRKVSSSNLTYSNKDSIFTSDGMQRITHDYVYYIKSNSILIGAEFEKVVIILAVTAIIALAFDLALSQGYRPPKEHKKLTKRSVDGVGELQGIVVLAR